MGEQHSAIAGGPPATSAGEVDRPAATGLRPPPRGRASGAARPVPRPQLPADVAFLAADGFPRTWLDEAADVALAKGQAASEVLIHRGRISRDEYERRLAHHVGAAWQPDGPVPSGLDPIALDDTNALRVPGAIEHGAAGPRLFVSPEASGYERVATMARRSPGMFARAVFTGRQALRGSLFERAARGLVVRAVGRLAEEMPAFSALRRLTAAQAVVLTGVGAVLLVGLWIEPRAVGAALAVALGLFYLAIVLLRGMLMLRLDDVVRRPSDRYRPRPAAPEDFPVYSIVVALYREAGQVPDLVRALDRLDWPATRREVLLVCEADDPDTIGAIVRTGLPQGFELVLCPPALPRTKPKALQFALPLCSGAFTVIYDAEDRPDPLQLREAWDRMRAEGPAMACLQAPLLIHNGRQTWLTRLFAIEYLTQFCGVLPALESHGAALPLGGTSNHFRTDMLRAAGGWDPHNVTEDADLGIRLARLGFRCGTIGRPTWEEAPPILSVWLKQRTRWLKGWLQTVLVHSRRPLVTARKLGPRSALFFHLMTTSIIVSMLIHPFFLVHVGWELTMVAAGHGIANPLLFGLSLFNLVGGYTTYAFMAYGVIRLAGSAVSPLWLVTLPAYWLLISLAGWRALAQFATDPFRWEKTPHGLAKPRETANI